MTDNTVNSTATSVSTDAAQNPDNVVTLTDLQNVLVVLDIASTRGAFRGPELQPVGALYDKISKFLQAVAPPTPAEESTTTTEGSEVSTLGDTA